MNKKKEEYSRFLAAGLILTVVVLIAIGVYWMGETARLTQAAGSFADERVNRGRRIYQEQCVTCHGAQGEGGVGTALNNKTLLKNTLDEIFFSLIRSGVPNTQMPFWSVDFGGPLTDEDVRDVVAFIRAWEPTAPVIEAPVFVPSAERGALLFYNTCGACHGSNGQGGTAPVVNDLPTLAAQDDDWYRAMIGNGLPAKGMPGFGAVFTTEQQDDLIALMDAWRMGTQVTIPYNATCEISGAIFSLQQEDVNSAVLQVANAKSVSQGPGAEALRNIQDQLTAGDQAGAMSSLQDLYKKWPLGDAAMGAEIYTTFCAPCHGQNGEGGVGKQLKPNEYVQGITTPDLVKFLLEGRAGTAMAGFKGRLEEGQLADVIAFLRTWQP